MTNSCAHETGPWLAGQQWPRCLKCEIERLQGEYNAYRADGEPELRAANAEIMRLLCREQQLMEFLRSFISGGVNQDFKPWARELYQKLYSSHEPCEHRNEVNSIDDVAAICHSVTGLCCHILGSPGGPCTIGNCAAVRGYLGGPEFAQGASRDASSPSEQPDYQHLYQSEVASKMVLQGEYDSLKSDLHAVNNATETLEALKTAHQALLEVRHAQECGPGWYTRGEAGLFQQTSMWIRRGLDALNKTRPAWQPTQSRTSE